jgi:hypothetical protein
MKKVLLSLVILIVLTPMFLIFPKANAAEPPLIIIVVPKSGLDIKAELISEDLTITGIVSEKISESYIQFYNVHTIDETPLKDNVVFYIRTNIGDFVIEQEISGRQYNQLYTLDLNRGVLIEGKSLVRDVSLVTFRVTLTLLIEGLIFYLFGYRSKRTWLVFFAVNLVTQGTLNILINSTLPTSAYILLSFYVLEVFVLFFEWIVMVPLIKEGKKLKLISVIFLANVLSMLVGGYILLRFPI